ncbi:hypothetical protein N9A45_01290 [bacterium]|nr:hypothetical protein [bacterium]
MLFFILNVCIFESIYRTLSEIESMDAHQVFILFQEKRLPSVQDIHSVFVRGDVHTLELIALVHGELKATISMDKVFSHDPKKCEQMSEVMLTALVIRHSTFDGSMSKSAAVQDAIASFQGMVLSESVTPPISPRGGESKTVRLKRNFADECNNYFLYKSRTRVNTLASLFKARSTMQWVKAVASKVVVNDEQVDTNSFELWSGTDRHVHISDQSPCVFIEALANDTCKTFSWTLQDEHVINLDKLRQSLSKMIADDDRALFAILTCSIGLPTYGLYTPETFIRHWHNYRFKRINNANVIKTVCRELFSVAEEVTPKTEVSLLLERYSKQAFVIEETPKTAEAYMFRHWYSYPTETELRQLVERANAIRERCT